MKRALQVITWCSAAVLIAIATGAIMDQSREVRIVAVVAVFVMWLSWFLRLPNITR